MEFVWSDELAMLLVEEDGEDLSELAGWCQRPVGHRLPDDLTPLLFGRQLLARQRQPDRRDRQAS